MRQGEYGEYVVQSMIKRKILRPIKKQVRQIQFYAIDSIDYLVGRRDEMTPPKRMTATIGGGDFKAIGREFLRYFIELGELKPTDRVLDVGCGVGRMAVPLTQYLHREGGYEGFDICHDEVGWCIERISPKYPNFYFQVAEIYNKKYNAKGKYVASEYRFPYDDDCFDFVFLTSVFTHMLPQDVQRYLSEVSRVLKVGKKCLITFFLLNGESSKLLEAKVSSRSFGFELEGCRVKNRTLPESEVAYYEQYIREAYRKHKLTLVEPIRYGSWCGRSHYLSYQDIIVAIKTA